MFLRGLERKRIIALGQHLGTGILGYSMKEIEQFTVVDIERIDLAIRTRDSQDVEARYFFCDAYEMSWIMTMISNWLKPIGSWQEAERRGQLHCYFSGIGEWPIEKHGLRVKYNQDMDDYYQHRGITSWLQAEREGKLAMYFSGVGFFPKEKEAYRLRQYKGDYDIFLKSLTFERYLCYLRDYFDHIPARRQIYTSAVHFYQTAMCQISEYIEIIKDMDDPIYIPGDGVGIGSYVCRLLGKRYYSSEPSEMGSDAVIMGMITEKASYDQKRAKECVSVFFGNCVYEIFPKEVARWMELQYLKVEGVKVVICDDKGLIQSQCCLSNHEEPEVIYDRIECCRLKVTDSYEYYPGGSYKVWYSYERVRDFQYKYQAFYKHIKAGTVFVPIDVVAESIMSAIMYDIDRKDKFIKEIALIVVTSQVKGSWKDKDYVKITGREKDVGKAYLSRLLVQYKYDYPGFVRIMRDQSAFKYFKKRIKNIVFLTMRDVVLSPNLDVLHMATRSFMTELVHGKVGSVKFVNDEPVVIYPNVPIITSKSWECVKVKDYDRADVLESYVQQGMCFVARVKNPYSKQKINLGSQISKIVLVNYQQVTSVATYRLASSVVYDNDMENLETM